MVWRGKGLKWEEVREEGRGGGRSKNNQHLKIVEKAIWKLLFINSVCVCMCVYTHVLAYLIGVTLHRWYNAPLRSYKLSNEFLAQVWDTSLRIVGKGYPGDPQNTTGYCHCSRCKNLLLRTPHTWSQDREIKLTLTRTLLYEQTCTVRCRPLLKKVIQNHT